MVYSISVRNIDQWGYRGSGTKAIFIEPLFSETSDHFLPWHCLKLASQAIRKQSESLQERFQFRKPWKLFWSPPLSSFYNVPSFSELAFLVRRFLKL